MKLIITLLLLIPSLSWGLTFKDGKQVDGSSSTSTISKNGQSGKSYKTINWGNTEEHERDIKKEWSQDVVNDFTRISDFSHRFELRAKECGGADCSRGSYKGSYGRTEAYLNNPLDNQHAGEIGENWYAWSFYLDDSDLSSFTGKHMIQLGQFKQSFTNPIIEKYSHCETERDDFAGVTFMFQLQPDYEGLGVSREYCNEKGFYRLESKSNVVIDKSNLFNKWHDIILHVKWGEDGFMKLFVNGDLQYSEIGYISEMLYVPREKQYSSPTFRYGIYKNNIPKTYSGKLVAFYDGIARAKKCTDQKFSNLLNELGYSCNDLDDKNGFVINGEPRCLNCKFNLSDYASLASDKDFEDGPYNLSWYWLELNNKGNIIRNDYLGFDYVIIKNGNLSFTNFFPVNDISKENREKIDFTAQDGLFSVVGNLDLASDNTAQVTMVGPSEKNEDGNYYIDGFWSDREKIGILFKPLN